MTPQEMVDEVVRRATADGYPPEMTHKDSLLDCSVYAGFTDVNIASRVLIGAYHSKSAIINVMTHSLNVVQSLAYKPEH